MSTRHTSYWSRNLRIVFIMLILWLSVTASVVWFADDFSGAWAYWAAGYGAPLCYLALVGVYAFLMRRRAR